MHRRHLLTIFFSIIFISSAVVYTLSSNEQECGSFEIPASSGGDFYEYSAKGLVLLSSNKAVVADWGVVGGEGGQGGVELGAGSRLTVAIGTEPKETLSIDGIRSPSFQVSYVVSDPSRGRDLHIVDEWVDAETGETTEARMPSVEEVEGNVLHHRHFTRLEWPSLMHGPDLWERPLSAEDSWNFTFLEGFPNTRSELSNWRATVSVEDTWTDNGTCRSLVEVTHPYANATLLLSEDLPVPQKYEVRADGRDFQMHLREWEEGRGAELEPINRTGSPKPVQAADNPLEEQFLPDADGILSTEWSRAISAIQEDEEASSWLKDHPGARVAVTDYRQGASDSDVQNEWEVTWWPGPEGGSSMKNVVMNRSDAVSETLDDEISVRTSYVGGVAQPGINETVSLSSLGRLHRSVYGVPLETFSCDFRGVLGGSACFMAPHDDINKPRAGGTGAGVYHAGLIIDLRDGRLLQETSFAERLVDKPVQR